MALEDDVRVGSCWEFSGGTGHIGIILSETVHISDVTIDYVLPELISAPAVRKAPQGMVLWGMIEDDNIETLRQSNDPELQLLLYSSPTHLFPPSILPGHPLPPSISSSYRHYLRLAEFQFNVTTRPILQSFPILEVVRKHRIPFHVVVLQVTSNWGSNSTCLYHVGIHGEAL